MTVATAVRGVIADSVTITGTLVARDEVMVSPQIADLALIEIDAEAGDRVAAGQVLARMSHDTLATSLAQSEAQIARAQAAIAQAQSAVVEAQATRVQSDLAFGRTRELLTAGNASREVFEQRQAAAGIGSARLGAAQNALLAAQADERVAEAQAAEARVRLARADIRAPAAGIVSRRTARLGAVVSMAGEPLFRIIADGAVELEGDVPEALLARLHPGQPAQLTIPGRDDTQPGALRLVTPEIDHVTRLGRVRIAIAGDPPPVGGFARAAVEVARHEGVLVPASAVLADADGATVQVVRDEVVETRRVSIGLRDRGRVEIATGLQAGEKVVSVSGVFVRAGDRVTAVGEP